MVSFGCLDTSLLKSTSILLPGYTALQRFVQVMGTFTGGFTRLVLAKQELCTVNVEGDAWELYRPSL